MKRFRIITAICLTAISIMVAGNIWYLYSLYNSIKEQTLQTVSECVRKADILEIISRLNSAHQGEDDSSIMLPLVVQGEKSPAGGYEYPNILENLSQTMSECFHVIEQSDKRIPERDGALLNKLFKKELANYNLNPKLAVIQTIGESSGHHRGLWSIDFALT